MEGLGCGAVAHFMPRIYFYKPTFHYMPGTTPPTHFHKTIPVPKATTHPATQTIKSMRWPTNKRIYNFYIRIIIYL